MEDKIKNNLFDLYSVYNQYKLLFEFYKDHINIKSETEIRERINYILKNGIKQKDEISTLLWVLGENSNE